MPIGTKLEVITSRKLVEVHVGLRRQAHAELPGPGS